MCNIYRDKRRRLKTGDEGRQSLGETKVAADTVRDDEAES